MNGAEFQQYTVTKIVEAYDRTHRQPTGETSDEVRAALDPEGKRIMAAVQACHECAQCRRVEWPPSRKCNTHYCESDDYQRSREDRLRRAREREAVWALRAEFLASVIERANQIAQLFVNEIWAERAALPTVEQESAMEAHETDLRELEGKHAIDCAVFDDDVAATCTCRPDYTADDTETR